MMSPWWLTPSRPGTGHRWQGGGRDLWRSLGGQQPTNHAAWQLKWDQDGLPPSTGVRTSKMLKNIRKTANHFICLITLFFPPCVCYLLGDMQENIIVKDRIWSQKYWIHSWLHFFHTVNILLARTCFVPWHWTVSWQVTDKYWSFYLSKPPFPPLS